MRAVRRCAAAVAVVAAVLWCAAVLAEAAGNPALAVSAGTYLVTQEGYGALAQVTVGGDGSVSVTPMFISGLITSGPDSAVFAGDGTLLVANTGAGTISRVDTGNRTVITATLNKSELPSEVADMAVDPNHNDVWVIEYDGSAANSIARVDLGTGAVTAMNTGGVMAVGGITFNDDGSRLFVSSHAGAIAEIDPANGRVLRQISVHGSPDGLTYDPSTGYLFASGCQGLCEVDTGGHGGAKLNLVTVVAGADGDGIAADGNGHIYIANGSCGSLCRLDLTAGGNSSGVLVAAGIAGADDVTPLTGAGSALGSGCIALRGCFGAGGAGLAIAGTALVVFVGAAGFSTMRPVPLPLMAHAGSAAGAHATAAAHLAAGSHQVAPPHAPPPPPPPPTTHIQEEAGDKLLEAGGSGLEVGAQGVEERAAMEAQADAGATRIAGDDDDKDEETGDRE